MTNWIVDKTDVHIKWIESKHEARILAIEADGFEFPWGKKEFKLCLDERNSIGMVAEEQGKVVGYMIYEFADAYVRLLNIAVAKEHRRKGVGTAMVVKLLGKLSPSRRWRLTTEVRENNVVAQLFLRECGLRVVSIVHGFFSSEHTMEDAYVMEYRLARTTSHRKGENHGS